MVFFSSFFFANTLFLNIKTFLTLDSPVSLHSYSGHWCSKGVEGWLYTLPPWGCQTKTPKKLVQSQMIKVLNTLRLTSTILMGEAINRSLTWHWQHKESSGHCKLLMTRMSTLFISME